MDLQDVQDQNSANAILLSDTTSMRLEIWARPCQNIEFNSVAVPIRLFLTNRRSTTLRSESGEPKPAKGKLTGRLPGSIDRVQSLVLTRKIKLPTPFLKQYPMSSEPGE